MQNKKALTAIASVCLLAVVGVGSTLAYFTDSAQTANVATMGHVDVSLTETDSGGGITGDGLVFEDVLPGQTVEKDPTVTILEGSLDAYVRVRMDVVTEEDSTITADDLSLLETRLRQQIVSDGSWYYNGDEDCYYYSRPLSAGESAQMFQTVTIPGEWVNNTAEQTFRIELQAEAVQADFFTPALSEDGTQIISWNGISVEDYEGNQ